VIGFLFPVSRFPTSVAQALSLCGIASSRFASLRAGLRQQGGAARRPFMARSLRDSGLKP